MASDPLRHRDDPALRRGRSAVHAAVGVKRTDVAAGYAVAPATSGAVLMEFQSAVGPARDLVAEHDQREARRADDLSGARLAVDRILMPSS